MATCTQPLPFLVRLVSIDYYLARPAPKVDVSYAPLEGTAVDQVPVVRIFGSTPSGQKTCVHLHKAFPYFYVPYEDSFPDEPAQAQAFLRQLAQSLEAAMQQHQEPGAGRKQVVHAVQLVRAIPFYGYHPDERLFIKIVLYNPGQVTRIATLLQSGAVMNRPFQPHESHVPFLLQFKIDFNLYGMGLLRLCNVLFRHPVPEAQHTRQGWAESPALVPPEGVAYPDGRLRGAQSGQQGPNLTPPSPASHTQASRQWTVSNIPTQCLWSNVPAGARLPERQSKCELEVDACVEDILNRQELVRMPLAEAGPEVRMVESLQSMWDEEKLRIGGSPPPPPPEPTRTPKPLCQHIELVRAQLQAIVDEQSAEAAQQEAAQAPQPPASPLTAPPASQQAASYSQNSPAPTTSDAAAPAANLTPPAMPTTTAAAAAVAAATPAAATPGVTPRPASLLLHTQAANLLTGSPLAATPASRAQTGSGSRQPGAAPSEHRAPAGVGMHAPSQATQNTEEADKEIRELLAWMRQEEGSDNDEEADMLMALAEQAGPTPKSQTQRSSQQEVLQRLRQRRMSRLSHSQHEIEGILQCSEPEEGVSDSADELGDPAGHEPAAGPASGDAELMDQPDIEDMGALAHDLQDASMQEQHHQQQQQLAAVGQAGVSGRQATGMFANEPSRSGWSQLVDSVHMHPPLAHESSASPTSQSSPPALLLHNPAADHQQLPHMAAHQPLQQAGPPGAPQNSTAQLKAAQHGLEFQYDSFSDSMGDEAMPEAASSAPGNSDLAAEHRPAPAPPAAVDIRLAAHQEAVEGSGQAAPAEPQDQREAGQQHDQQGLNDEEQQQHSQPQPGVLPQADGAGDSDSVDSQDPPAQQYGTNSRHMCSTGALPDQQPAKPALQARQGPSQQQERLVMPDSVAVQRPRRRRGRLVVQHAVRLAAAARNAMDSVATPQDAGSMPALQGDTCGYASEPQLPSWLVPQAAADRQFQSEPQLPDAHNTLGDVPEMNASMPTGSAAWRGQRQRAHRVHAPSKDSQYGGLGRHAIASRHHASQSTVAAAAAGCAPHVTSQILSDSRATSDRQWQQQQRHQHSHLPRLQQSQRVASQVVVSDSRATSDLRWAQHGQARQAAPQQQPSPSQDAAGWGGFAPTPGHELAWEQPASDQAMSMFQASGAASGAASMAASGADAGADDLEIVISDSQPSPLQRPGRLVESPQSATAAPPQKAASAEAAQVHDRPRDLHNPPLDSIPSTGPSHLPSDGKEPEPHHLQHNPGNAGEPATLTQAPVGVNLDIGNKQHEQQSPLPAAAAARGPADMSVEVAPSFCTRHRPAADELSSQALTPVMMPHAWARIQAQHGAASPSLAAVKDTPQTATAATPCSRVKDTPSSEVTPLHRGVLPQGLWQGLDQPPASKPLSVPRLSSAHNTSHALQQQHVSGGGTAPGGVDQVHPFGTLQEQLHASPPAPELTLRLSLSDGSSTKSNKAGQPSSDKDVPAPHPQQLLTATPTHSSVRLPPKLLVDTVAAVSKTAPHSDSLRVLLPPQQSLHASQPALGSLAGGLLENRQLQSHLPAAAISNEDQAAHQDDVPSSLAAAAAAAAAAVAARLAGANPTPNNGSAFWHRPQGGVKDSLEQLATSQGDVMNAEPTASCKGEGQHSRSGAAGGEAAGHVDPDLAGQRADYPHDGDGVPSPEAGHDTLLGGSPDHAALHNTDPDADSPDDPDPDSTGSDDAAAAADEELVPYRYKQRAPTQRELDVSMEKQSILPIIHPEPFYGNPSDVPDRPVVFAGLEFKVPSSAVGNLPLFTRSRATGGAGPMAHLKAAASMRQQQQLAQQAQQAQQLKLFKHVPARLPPSQQVITDWLDAESAMHAPPASSSSSSRAAAAQAAAGSGFVMDANTGRLVPLQASATQNSEEDVASSLLGTPYLATQASNPRAPVTTPRRLASAPAQQDNQQEEEQEEEEVRPASPKYDERSFFYTTPAAFKPAALSGRPQTQWATQGSFLAAAPQQPPPFNHPNAPSTSQAATPVLHAHQQQQQQQQQQQGNASNLLNAPPENPAGEAAVPGAMAPPLPRPAVFQGNRPAAAAAAAGHGGAGVGAGGPNKRFVSQITPPSPGSGLSGPTPVSQAGFRRLVPGKGQQLTLLSIEIHADTRGSLLPDPRYDAVRAIVLAVMDDVEECPDGLYTARLMMFDDSGKPPKDAMTHVQVEVFQSEKALLEAFIDASQALDPDIILGFEVQKGSLGYLADRAATMDIPLLKLVSRTPEMLSPKDRQNDEYGALHASGIHCTGRIVLNVWRILRSELKLNIYTFESCVAAVLQLRTPHVQPHVLTHWFNGGPAGGRWRCLHYWLRRTRLNLALLEQLDLIGRTAELARAFGIDFFSVLSRGSQYRVESMMLRLAHTQNYLMLSPAKEQVANQPAMEAVPLILEPESRFYTDPVLVLDFQSLYPSIIIAYNLCYSTVVGRPAHAAAAGQEVKLGAANYALPPATLTGPNSPDKLVIAANGVAYLPHAARPGIVPRLLQEILSTRIMVKGAMKSTPASHKVLQRVMNARQFGLKLIANVTYGYTSAGFSGRMPMAEIADSIVQSARETLENAIRMVEASTKWKARVVYGDTDSMFVLLPGRSREEAFRIGTEIAKEVTASNPPPVTLKFEKVYHPCVLLTKKRYVGYMYESPTQAVPGFDAKGIETVRRDTCPAVAKTMERSLRLLFATRDLSEVKEYLERQWHKILANRVSVQDFVFAKEVRLGTYSPKAAVVPPAAIVAAKAMATDPRAEPRFAERVPYVVVYGEPGARLVDMVVSPHALVESSSRLRLHSIYYITKQIIPALERIFSLVGADLRAWFAAMPRPQKLLPQKRPQGAHAGREAASEHLGPGRPATVVGTIDRYYLSRHCAVCDGLTHAAQPLCTQCQLDPQLAAAVLTARSGRLERQKVAHELAAAAALSQAGLALLD